MQVSYEYGIIFASKEARKQVYTHGKHVRSHNFREVQRHWFDSSLSRIQSIANNINSAALEESVIVWFVSVIFSVEKLIST